MESLGYAAKTADFFNGFSPCGLSAEAPNVSSGGRKHSRTLMSEPGGSIWGPEMALTASGGLSPAARWLLTPTSPGSQLVLERSPSAQSECIVPEKSGERAKEA